jgi:SLT domain-containing protein
MPLTVDAALALALSCGIPQSLAPVIVGIAQHESSLNPNAINHNPNGTEDVGLVQVNTVNFGWLGIHSVTEALDPCVNLTAGLRVLFVRYNGAPPPEVAKAYADAVWSRVKAINAADHIDQPSPPSPSSPRSTPTSFDDRPAKPEHETIFNGVK